MPLWIFFVPSSTFEDWSVSYQKRGSRFSYEFSSLLSSQRREICIGCKRNTRVVGSFEKLKIFVYIFGSSDKWFLRDERMSIFKIIYFSMDRIWATSVRVEKEEHRRGEEGWWWVTRFYFKRARCKKRPCIYILSFSRLSTLNVAVILPREPSVCMLKRFETGGTGIIFARLRLVSSIVSFLKMKLDSMILLEI